MMRTPVFLFFVTLTLLSTTLSAQQKTSADSVTTAQPRALLSEQKDTATLTSYAQRYNPRKALLFAAILPGLGQVYTKKYWKIPLVYGGIYGLGSMVNGYQQGYNKYKLELFSVIGTSNYSTSKFTESQLRSIVDKYRRERDFYLIMMGLMYILQIVDAHVDAHLKEFDLNPNLQVRLEPMIEQNPVAGRQAGLSLLMRF